MCASTSVGRWTFSMTLAIVNVLPEPVTPSKTCSSRPIFTPCASFSMASGWSPVGLKGACSLNSISVSLSFGQKSVVPQGDKVVVRDDDVVGELDAHGAQRVED